VAQGLFVLGYLLVREDWDVGPVLRSPQFHRFLLAVGVVFMGFLPWLPYLLRQRAQVQAGYWTAPVTEWDVARVWYQMFVEPEGGWPASRQGQLLVTDLCVLGLLALWWKARPGEWFVLCAAVVPFALSIVISQLDTKIFTLRYFLFAHLFFLAGLAVLVNRIPFRFERAVVAAVVLVNFLAIYLGFWDKMDIAHKPGFRAAVKHIQQKRQAGEPVVVGSPLAYLSVLYYAR